MKRSHLIAVLVGFMTIVAFGSDALAMYHGGMGRFLSRDPGPGGVVSPVRAGQYDDGMNLYQYVRSNSVTFVDPSGAQATRPVDATRALAMQRCEAKLGALRDLISGDKGAVGKFARCAIKRGTLDLAKMACTYDLPNDVGSTAIAWYSSASGAITINARMFVGSPDGAGNYWGTFLHELTHAVDAKEAAKWSNNACMQRMLKEARAYWRTDDKCSCAEACNRAWNSAQYGCFMSEAWLPWSRRLLAAATQPVPPGGRPADPAPRQAEWYPANKDRWVGACQAVCDKDGPLKSNRSVDGDCDAELGAR